MRISDWSSDVCSSDLLRLQPGASRAKVDGPARLDDGALVLKLRVTEPPEAGKANAALVRLLANSWGLPKSTLSLVAGNTDRRKTLPGAWDPPAPGRVHTRSRAGFAHAETTTGMTPRRG